MKLLKPEKLTIKRKKQINAILKSAYQWANDNGFPCFKYKKMYKV